MGDARSEAQLAALTEKMKDRKVTKIEAVVRTETTEAIERAIGELKEDWLLMVDHTPIAGFDHIELRRSDGLMINFMEKEPPTAHADKVLGILAAICVACTLVLLAVAGPVGSPPVSRQIGGEIGRWLFIWGVSAVFAVGGFLVKRKDLGAQYPGLTIGTVVAVVITVLLLIRKLGV